MTLAIKVTKVNNQNKDVAAAVIIGFKPPSADAPFHDFLGAVFVAGGSLYEMSMPPLYITEKQNPPPEHPLPLMYVATTTSLGFFYLDGLVATYPYCKLGQNSPNGVWTQTIVDGGTYTLEINNGGIVGLTPN